MEAIRPRGPDQQARGIDDGDAVVFELLGILSHLTIILFGKSIESGIVATHEYRQASDASVLPQLDKALHALLDHK